jgi:hypothetical protein
MKALYCVPLEDMKNKEFSKPRSGEIFVEENAPQNACRLIEMLPIEKGTTINRKLEISAPVYGT